MEHLMFRLIICCLVLGVSSPAWATIYHVETTGNDSTGNGSVSQPWANPQKCVDAGSPLVAGDVCEVGSGTYGISTVPGRVVLTTASSPGGTAGNPITIRSATPLGAHIVVPNSWSGANCDIDNCPFSGFYLSKPGYIIEGFDITRPGSSYGNTAAVLGISIAGANDTIIRRNHIHDIGRTVCHNGLLGQAGIYIEYTSRVTVEYNQFDTIGRLRNGESGCVTDKFQHDHGVYANSTTDLTIRYNLFYDVNRGMPLNIKAYFGQTTRLKVYNNTISGKTPTSDGKPDGQVALTNTVVDSEFKNNIFHAVNSATDGYVFWWYTNSVMTNLVIDHNLSDSTSGTILNPYLKPTSGITYTNNTLNTNPGFVNAGARDYTLALGSAAINAGVNVGLPFNGTAPDIGALESGGAPLDTTPPAAPKVVQIQ